MNDEMTSWLLSKAGALRKGVQNEIDIERSLREFGIRLLLQTSDRRSGALSKSVEGEWVVMVRGKRQVNCLTAADRFTAAHELGHYLLIKHWNHSPSIDNKRDYYDCESLCNQFASRLLIDHGEIASSAIESPQECLGRVRGWAKQYMVSNEAAARVVVETHPSMVICAFKRVESGRWNRSWAVASLKGVSRFGTKQVKSDTVLEEIIVLSSKLLGKKLTGQEFAFATETIEQSVIGAASEGQVRITKQDRAPNVNASGKIMGQNLEGKAELSVAMIKNSPVNV